MALGSDSTAWKIREHQDHVSELAGILLGEQCAPQCWLLSHGMTFPEALELHNMRIVLAIVDGEAVWRCLSSC